MREATKVLILLLSVALVSSAQDPDSRCDFSSYKPLVISHAPLGGAIHTVKPRYPPVARGARAAGPVQVKILVDLKGDVVRACAVDGNPLLRHASENAALAWKFKRNFGFSGKLKRQYLQSWIIFTFHLAEISLE